jgi:hypothetical protein
MESHFKRKLYTIIVNVLGSAFWVQRFGVQGFGVRVRGLRDFGFGSADFGFRDEYFDFGNIKITDESYDILS